MKNLLFPFFLLLGLNAMIAQQDIRWQNPIPVTSAGNSSPVVGVLEDGTPVVVWGHNSSIYFSRKLGEEFTDPVEIMTGGVSPQFYSFGGIDMAVKGNQIHIVFENFTAGIHQIRSIDGGLTFEDRVPVYDPPSDKWATLPSIKLDANGNPYVSVIFENTNETNGLYFLMRSTNGGESFLPPTVANDPADGNYVCECCPSDIHIKGEEVFLVFRNNDDNLRDMWVTKSSDGGATFDQAVDVDTTDWYLTFCPISGPAIAPFTDDNLLTFWSSGASGISRAYLSSFNGTSMEKGFELLIPQANENASQQRPDIAGLNDTIGIVWEESGFDANGVDLRFALYAKDTQLSDIANITNAPGNQQFPSLEFHDGLFHLVYTDGNGGLMYRQGLLAQANAVSNQSLQALNIQLVQQPIDNNLIQLKVNDLVNEETLQITCYDLAGNEMQAWQERTPAPKEVLSLPLQKALSGMYLLSVKTTKGYWSKKILILNP